MAGLLPLLAQAAIGGLAAVRGADSGKGPRVRLQLSSGVEDGHHVLHVAGAIDLASAGDLRTALLSLINTAGPTLVVDVSEVTFCDSTGLSALLMAARRAAADGRRLVLVGPSPQLRKILDVTKLERLLPVYDALSDVPRQAPD